MSEIGKWTVSVDEANWNDDGEWDTEYDAIKNGPKSLGLDPGDTYYVGQIRAPVICVPDAGDVIEHITCQDDFNLECAEDAFACTREQREELTAAIETTFNEWMTRHGLVPTFFLIENAKKHICPESSDE